MVPDAELDAQHLRSEVLPLLLDDQRRGAMAEAARAFGITDAAEVMADVVIGVARRA